MRHSLIKTFVFLFVLVIALISADHYLFDRKLSFLGQVLIQKPFSSAFSKFENAGFFMRSFFMARSIRTENENLKRENAELLSRLADYENKKSENIFLKAALGLSSRPYGRIVYADIYQFQLGPSGYDVLLNRGAGDGVLEGDVIVTEDNILVGVVEKTYDSFSRALVVNDLDFSVAARILSSGTAGIAKGALNQGMFLDLVTQADLMEEGDTVVTSGMDLIPPNLVVGTVNYVEANKTDLFKKVKITPAIGETKIGRVLIIGRSLK